MEDLLGVLGDSVGAELVARLLKQPCPTCKAAFGMSIVHSEETWTLIDKDRKKR